MSGKIRGQTSDSNTEAITAIKPPNSVARFQNRPSVKIATTPGVKKPVQFWIF